MNLIECLSFFCYGLVICIDRVDGFECVCVVGFIGVYCYYDINDCGILNLCRNGGICLDRYMGY